jgi:hypothetical protein
MLLLGIIVNGFICTQLLAFEYESWPREGPFYFEVITDKLVLHDKPASDSPVIASISAKKGTIVSDASGVKQLIRLQKNGGHLVGIRGSAKVNVDIILGRRIQKTIKPGIIRALEGGVAENMLIFNKNDVIEFMMPLSEGRCLLRYKGNPVENSTCLDYELRVEQSLVLESRPVVEWWISIEQNNKPNGWIMVDDKTSLRTIN